MAEQRELHKENVLIGIGATLTRWSQKYMPDPSVFAVLLTLLAFLMAIGITDTTVFQAIENWYKGLWQLLVFAMQMCLMMITGAAITETPLVKKWIDRISAIPKDGKQATFVVAMASILISYFHFGLSLVCSALLAKNIARSLTKQGKPCEYSLIAAAYLGQMTWCVGFSNSVGLLIATPGHFLESEMGIIPLTSYIFNPMNMVLAICFLAVPFFAASLHPKGANVTPIPDYAMKVLMDEPVIEQKREKYDTIGEKLNNSRLMAWAICLIAFVYVGRYFYLNGFMLDLNTLNTIFLFAGLALHGCLGNYVSAFRNGTSSVSGVIFQFPLYAGIMGIIQFSGLATIMADWIVAISTPGTFFVWTFISASIVNMFVPSGGGQWAVQGPIAVRSAAMMDMNVLKASQCVAYGNSWTNMCQPFWALALLGFTGLKAKDIMGYSTAIMLFAGIMFLGVILLLPV